MIIIILRLAFLKRLKYDVGASIDLGDDNSWSKLLGVRFDLLEFERTPSIHLEVVLKLYITYNNIVENSKCFFFNSFETKHTSWCFQRDRLWDTVNSVILAFLQ